MRKQRETSLEGTYKPRFALAMQWLTSTAEALAFLHNRDQPIVHRDLKPCPGAVLAVRSRLKLEAKPAAHQRSSAQGWSESSFWHRDRKVTDLGISKATHSRVSG